MPASRRVGRRGCIRYSSRRYSALHLATLIFKRAVHICSVGNLCRLRALLARYGLSVERVPNDASIIGTYWGEPEAGLVGATVYVRADTPLHSALHEAAHAVCMDDARRARLHTDAGGDYAEENAVCFLQIMLAQELGLAAPSICADLDAWGYTFRLGSAYAWYTHDAEDARAWLVHYGLLTPAGALTWRRRDGCNRASAAS